MKRSRLKKPYAGPTVAAIFIACLVVLLVAPSLSSAQTINLNLTDLGISLDGISIPSIPLISAPQTPAPAAPAPTAAAADSGGYGGYANGYNGAVNLFDNLGTADIGLSTGGINSAGGIVPDWAGTPQDESKALAAGIVEAAGLRMLNIPLSFGSAGTTASPESGMLGSVQQLDVPGVGRVNLAYYETQSGATGTSNQMKILLVNVEALNLNMVIPIGQSSANVTRTGSKVSSMSTSTLVGAGPKQPIKVGSGLLNNGDLLSVLAVDAGSSSSADGTTASSSSYWTIADLGVLGQSALVFNSNDGIKLGGTTLVPSPTGGKPLLTIDQFADLAVITIGETWSQTDGKSYAFGGANAVRVGLLGQDSLLVLGHAGSGANAVSATGPGAGPDQTTEGPGDSNIPPDQVSPPNTVPIIPGDRENPIGPGPEPKPDPNPIVPETPSFGGPPATDVPGGGDTPLSLNRVLPNTGAELLVYLMVASALTIMASYAYKPLVRSFNRD